MKKVALTAAQKAVQTVALSGRKMVAQLVEKWAVRMAALKAAQLVESSAAEMVVPMD